MGRAPALFRGVSPEREIRIDPPFLARQGIKNAAYHQFATSPAGREISRRFIDYPANEPARGDIGREATNRFGEMIARPDIRKGCELLATLKHQRQFVIGMDEIGHVVDRVIAMYLLKIGIEFGRRHAERSDQREFMGFEHVDTLKLGIVLDIEI